MRSSSLLTLSALLPAVLASPAPWSPVSPRSGLAARMSEDAELAARSTLLSADAFCQGEYDYIVIGAGTAGLAIAARLSEDPSKKVGVLEAGGSGFNVSIIDIPGQFGADLNTVYDWNYTTIATDNAPVVHWPRGKVLGGSSALNFLVWDRASKAEYDAWEELGSKGWNWKNLYKYMKRSEDFSAPSQETLEGLNIQPVESDYGQSGPIQISFPRYVSEQVSNWIPALKSLGIPGNQQPLAGENIGASLQPSNINQVNQTRSYSAPAYYFKNSNRKNLKVITNAQATKINFSPSPLFSSGDRTAKSVSFVSKGKTYQATLKSKGEVIVSGGTVNTPQILELSGIGNPDILKKQGIKTIVNNSNVGENVQDHTYSSAAYELKDGHITLDSLRNNATFAQEQGALYAANQTSILSETVPSIAYISLSTLVGNETAAKLSSDLTAYAQSSKAPYKKTLTKQAEFLSKNPETISSMELIGIDGFFATNGAPEAGKNYVTFLAAQQHLASRGSIHINSSDPLAYPIIDAGYYSVPYDVSVATAGTDYLRKIAGSPEYSAYIEKEIVPGAAITDLTEYTTTIGFTTEYHHLGSASMLPRKEGGVVDNKLVVYGTSNVRVCDASIMPLHISAHIQATVYGIAEALADIIHGKFDFNA